MPAGKAGVSNPGPARLQRDPLCLHVGGNNNGSAFAGLNANTPFYNTTLGIAMLFGALLADRFRSWRSPGRWRKKRVPASAGTLPTHTPLFVVWLIAVVIIVGALSFFPALALGPIVEHLDDD